MASQRDVFGSFSCRRFEELFAESPRAKEIFATVYGKSDNNRPERKERYDNPIASLKTSLVRKSSGGVQEKPRCTRPSKSAWEIIPNFHEKPKEIDHIAMPGLSQGDGFSETNLQDVDSSLKGINISFGGAEEDEQMAELDSFNNQVVVVLKKLDEADKRKTEQQDQAVNVAGKKEQVLCDWSLRIVEMNNQKHIIVEGHRRGDCDEQNWRSTVICKRVSSTCIKTKSGSLYYLSEKIDEQQMAEKGFSKQLITAFKNGFPIQWKRILEKYFKEMESLNNQSNLVREIEHPPKAKCNEKIKEKMTRQSRKESSTPVKKQKTKTSDIKEKKGKTSEITEKKGKLSDMKEKKGKAAEVREKKEKASDITEKKGKMSQITEKKLNTSLIKDEKVKTSKIPSQQRQHKQQQQQQHEQKQSRNSKKIEAFKTPPPVLPKEEEVKRSRSGRIIAPPLEYWRGQRMITSAKKDTISIVKCHSEETSVLVKRSTPLSRKVSWSQNSRNEKRLSKGLRNRLENSGEETTTTDNVATCTTSGSEYVHTDSVLSDSPSDSTVVKTLTYTSTSSSNDAEVARIEDKANVEERTEEEGEATEKDVESGNRITATKSGERKQAENERSAAAEIMVSSCGELVGSDDGVVSSVDQRMTSNGDVKQGKHKAREDSERESNAEIYRSRLRLRSNPGGKNRGVVEQMGAKINPSASKTVGETFQSESNRKRKSLRVKDANNNAVGLLDGKNSERDKITTEVAIKNSFETLNIHQKNDSLASKRARISDIESSDTESRASRMTRGLSGKSARMSMKINEPQTSDSESLNVIHRKRPTRNNNIDSSDAEAGEVRNVRDKNGGKRNEQNTLESGDVQSRKTAQLVNSKIAEDRRENNEVGLLDVVNKETSDAVMLAGAMKNTGVNNKRTTRLRTRLQLKNQGNDMDRIVRAVSKGKGPVVQRTSTAQETSMVQGTSKNTRKHETSRVQATSRVQGISRVLRNQESYMDKIDRVVSNGTVAYGTSRGQQETSREQKETSREEGTSRVLRDDDVTTAEPVKAVTRKIRAKSNKTRSTGQKTVASVQPTGALMDEEMWNADEHDKLIQALSQIPTSTSMYWQKVAQLVKTRSAEECQLHIQNEKDTTRRKKKVSRKVKEKPVTKELTAKVGTLARKRQLRDILEQQDDGYEDDFYDSTPFRNTRLVKFSPVNLENEDIVCEDEHGTDPDYKTPGSRTPKNRLRPDGPLTASGTSETEFISPGLLQSVNRQDVDRYVHHLKKRKLGRRNIKQVKSRTPISKKTSTPHPLSFNAADCFNIREASHSENEEEDYYWSDE